MTALIMVVMAVLGFGPSNAYAQQWETFYSPEYKFAFDYRQNQTVIVDQVVNGKDLMKNITSASINFIVTVEKTTKDPQEILVAYSQNLSPGTITIEGGVKPIMVDWIPGYMINTLNLNSVAMVTGINFEHHGYIYTFLLQQLSDSFDRREVHKVVESIKFFD
jgi:hypothetical protein